MMKKPVLAIDEPAPRKAIRADRPPTEGFVTIVDGHFKTEFDTVEARNIGPGTQVGLSGASDRNL